MKSKSGFVFIVGVLLSGVAIAEMHAFELKDGRALEAEVVGFNSKLGKVELKRPDGKHVKVAPNVFVEADQGYIQEWAMLDGFKNESVFKLSCKKKKTEQWKEEDSAFQMKFERYVYEITVENRNAFSVQKLKIEYKVFYEQEENDQNTKKVLTTKHAERGVFDLEKMNERQKKVLTTKSVVLQEFEFNMSDYYVPDGDPESTGGEIKGLWLRITAETPSGQSYTRNIYEPASLEGKYRW